MRDGSPSIAGADFTNSTFLSDVVFRGVNFSGEAKFVGMTVDGSLRFEKSRMGSASFGGLRVVGDLTVDGVVVAGDLLADSAIEVEGSLSVAELVCEKTSIIEAVVCTGGIDIRDSTFEGDARWRHVKAASFICSAEFSDRLMVEIDSAETKFAKGQFDKGLTLTLASGVANLDHATLGGPSVITGTLCPGPAAIGSLRDVDVSKLTLRNVNVAACHFGLAHGVDAITLDDVHFGSPSRWWQSERAVVAEESAGTDSPVSVARVYRTLRKAIESSKDDPGAADFYYGEMLMRRRQRWRDIAVGNLGSRVAALVDYLLLSVYWAVSGFGLRIGRSLGVFAALVGSAAVLIAAVGYPPAKLTYVPVGTTKYGMLRYGSELTHSDGFGDNLGRAFRLAAQSSVSLLQSPSQTLTPVGEWVVLILRFAGPIVLGLAILAVRNKLRR